MTLTYLLPPLQCNQAAAVSKLNPSGASQHPIQNPLRDPSRASKGHATADRAHGIPEGRAPRVAGAHAAGTGKPYFYGAGRILGRVSRLYGYSLLLSGISSLFLSGFSSLPLTKWDDEDKGGVPRADVGVVSILLMLWCTAGVSCLSRAVRDVPS